MKTVMLADGYNGDLVECDIEPIAVDGDLLKLHVTGKPWLIRWIHKDDLRKAVVEKIASDYNLPSHTNLREAVSRGFDAGVQSSNRGQAPDVVPDRQA